MCHWPASPTHQTSAVWFVILRRCNFQYKSCGRDVCWSGIDVQQQIANIDSCCHVLPPSDRESQASITESRPAVPKHLAAANEQPSCQSKHLCISSDMMIGAELGYTVSPTHELRSCQRTEHSVRALTLQAILTQSRHHITDSTPPRNQGVHTRGTTKQAFNYLQHVWPSSMLRSDV